MKTFVMIAIGALALAGCGDDEPIADQRASPAVAAPPAATEAATPAQPTLATGQQPASAPMAGESAVQAAPAQATSADPAGGTYTVQKGDTLYGIAESRDLTADDLARWNDISDPRRLRIGQELRLTAP